VPDRAGAAALAGRARYPLLFAAGALLSGLTILNGINPHDEGLVLQAASRIVHGELPYRDFYANYGPGQYYLDGALDYVFGPSLLTWRIVRVALDAVVAVLAYALVRREGSEPLAVLAWVAVLAAMAHPTLPHPNAAALALAFGTILLARRSPVAAGVLAGVAFAFRFDLGAAAAVGAALAAAARGPDQAAAARDPAPAARVYAAPLRALLAACATAAALVLPFVIAAPGDFWNDTFGFALDEQALQRLPLPGGWDGGFELNKILAFYMPWVLIGGLALWLAAAAVLRPPLRVWALLPVALAGLAYLLARADEFHLVPLAVALPVLLAATAPHARRTAPALALAVPVALIALNGIDQNRIDLIDPGPLRPIHVDVADGVKAPPGEARALEQTVAYIRRTVPPDRPIFVANPRHDLVHVGNPLVYVLAGRPNPTRYDVMQPGVVTTAAVQREIAGDLRRSRTGLVVRWLSPVAAQREPNGAGRSSGVRVLDRYLAAVYAPVARFGDYQLLRLAGPRAE
jgi:hypothetical protein